MTKKRWENHEKTVGK